MCLVRRSERSQKYSLGPSLDGTVQLSCRLPGITEGDMRDRNKPTARIRAEIDNPAIVGPAVGSGDLDVLDLTLPEQPQSGIENGGGQSFLIEELHTLFGVHGTERGRLAIGFLHRGRDLFVFTTHRAGLT